MITNKEIPVKSGLSNQLTHLSVIVGTDPAYGGDILCIELIPEVNYNFQLKLTAGWLILLTLSWGHLFYKRRQLQRMGQGYIYTQQFLHPLFVVYPMLKLVSHASVLYLMGICYQEDHINPTLIRYLMMVNITSETIFWSLFYAIQYLTVSGYGNVHWSVSR